jgi:glyoxylase-like metal-dependent hydrolase (beta-lactamase superfamily II)
MVLACGCHDATMPWSEAGVTTRVLAIPTGVANAYAIPAADGVTLVDTGGPGGLGRLQGALRRHGIALSDVRRVFVTHAHVDHTGSLAALVDACDPIVLAHALDAPFVRAGSNPPFADPASLGPLDRLMARMSSAAAPPARVDREVAGDETLDEVAPGARVVHLPGHTPGQAGLWLPDRRFLIGGDVALHLLPWRLSLPFAAFTTDMGDALVSVERAASLTPLGLGLGHGPPLRSGATTRLRRLLRRHGRFATAPP